jgi:hypothetical protein
MVELKNIAQNERYVSGIFDNKEKARLIMSGIGIEFDHSRDIGQKTETFPIK